MHFTPFPNLYTDTIQDSAEGFFSKSWESFTFKKKISMFAKTNKL